MKIVTIIARVLLGLMFVVFGLNGFFNFLPHPPPTGMALQYFVAMSASHAITAAFLCQAVGGALLLVNRYVPIGLVLLGPVIVNILLYHAGIDPKGIGPGIVVSILWLIVFSSVRSAFAGVFAARTDS